MSESQTAAIGGRVLPTRPSLEHLKGEAKQQLAAMRRDDEKATLSAAQRAIAQSYGYPSWRALKAEVERKGHATARSTAPTCDQCVGHYLSDPRYVTDSVASVTQEGGRLFVQWTGEVRQPLTDRGGGLFGLQGTAITYRFDADGEAPASKLVCANEVGSISLPRTDAAAARAAMDGVAKAARTWARPRTPVQPALGSLDRLAGYYTNNRGVVFEAAVEGDTLHTRFAGQDMAPIQAESETSFFFYWTPIQLDFELDSAGAVVAATWRQSGQASRYLPTTARRFAVLAAPVDRKAAEQKKPRTLSKVNPTVLTNYVGRYRLHSDFVLTVTASKGALYVEPTGQPRNEVYPESDKTFFWTIRPIQISFVTDEQGRATHAVLHQAGRDMPMMREEERG